MAEYIKSDELAQLGKKVIMEYPDEFSDILDYDCRIGYQYSDVAKKSGGKLVYADTTRVSDKLKEFADLDFVITFYSPYTEELSEEILERLMYHELLHIGFKDGKASIIPHDLEDFRKLIEKWGVDWLIDDGAMAPEDDEPEED